MVTKQLVENQNPTVIVTHAILLRKSDSAVKLNALAPDVSGGLANNNLRCRYRSLSTTRAFAVDALGCVAQYRYGVLVVDKHFRESMLKYLKTTQSLSKLHSSF